MPRSVIGRCVGALLLCVVGPVLAQGLEGPGGQPVEEPLLVNGRLIFPEGAAIPRSLTPTERRYLESHPLSPQRDARGAPGGDIFCVPEYAPMQVILIAWQGLNSWKDILANMASHITTTGDADLHVAINTSDAIPAAQATLAAAGTDMSRVTFFVRPTNTIWIRDYGPRYIYTNGIRAVVDHTYNRPRPNDNAFNTYYAGQMGHQDYLLPLVHGGGNYHLSAVGDGYATKLIENENPGLTRAQIVGHWFDYQNVETEITPAFPLNIDSTQHIDMWMIVTDDRSVIISEWPLAPSSTQAIICDDQAASMAADGYAVYRTPAVTSGGTHYTFTNSVICNDLVLIPSYTNATAAQYNAAALQVWQQAMPGKTVVQIPSQAIVTHAGVLHCIVMHIPVPLGDGNPVVSVTEPAGGEVYMPGEQATIRWLSDHDDLTYYVTIYLSADSGETYDTVITNFHPDSGDFTWTVPDINTNRARVRVAVYDFAGKVGYDASAADFTIGNPCYADCNGDGQVNTLDFICFLNHYTSGDPAADCNGDGEINTLDFICFLNAYTLGC